MLLYTVYASHTTKIAEDRVWNEKLQEEKGKLRALNKASRTVKSWTVIVILCPEYSHTAILAL